MTFKITSFRILKITNAMAFMMKPQGYHGADRTPTLTSP